MQISVSLIRSKLESANALSVLFLDVFMSAKRPIVSWKFSAVPPKLMAEIVLFKFPNGKHVALFFNSTIPFSIAAACADALKLFRCLNSSLYQIFGWSFCFFIGLHVLLLTQNDIKIVAAIEIVIARNNFFMFNMVCL